MRLIELAPQFIKLTEELGSYRTDASIGDCDGLCFLCPKCFSENHGPIGTHGIICWKPHIPQTIRPTPGRWPHTGTSFNDLTLTPSIQITGSCSWHGFIRNGEIINA